MVDFVTPKWIFMITVVVKLKKLYKDLIKYTFHFTNNDPLKFQQSEHDLHEEMQGMEQDCEFCQ